MIKTFSSKTFICSVVLVSQTLSAYAWDPETGEKPKSLDNYEYVNEQPIDLALLAGKPTLLYFGGDWCPPCGETRPDVLKFAKQYSERVNVVFISSDDNKHRAAKFAESQSVGYKIAMPQLQKYPVGSTNRGTSQIGAFGRIYTWPTLVLLDEKGFVVKKIEKRDPIRREIANYSKTLSN